MADAPFERIRGAKMAPLLRSCGPYPVLKSNALVHWKAYSEKKKKYALRGPIVELENADPSDKKIWHPRQGHYNGRGCQQLSNSSDLIPQPSDADKRELVSNQWSCNGHEKINGILIGQ